MRGEPLNLDEQARDEVGAFNKQLASLGDEAAVEGLISSLEQELLGFSLTLSYDERRTQNIVAVKRDNARQHLRGLRRRGNSSGK